MPLIFNDPAFLRDAIGMPLSHAAAFRSAATSQRCVIISRATGPTCLQLLAEGYDTKGYRIHGKSCDWGPMAGFVLRDPRLNKTGAAAFNREKHHEALVADHEQQGWKADVTPLMISAERIEWLLAANLITLTRRLADRQDGVALHGPSGVTFKYSLIREENGMWGVYFDNSDPNRRFVQERGGAVVRYHRKYRGNWEPMLALTNPPSHRTFRQEHYLNAITGDYDLFAIWPFARDYAPQGADHRPLGTILGYTPEEAMDIEYLEGHFTKTGSTTYQGTKLGNITDRIYMVGQVINSLVGGMTSQSGARTCGPFPSRNVIWHSDETARPFVRSIDLPIVAFAPSGDYYCLRTVDDFRDFILLCERNRIKVTLSKAWVQANGLGAPFRNRVPIFNPASRRLVPEWYNR